MKPEQGSDSSKPSALDWFRRFAPYLHAHRGKTFVVYFGGERLIDPAFPELLQDLALLRALDIRIVLVHGIRPQIDEGLKRLGAGAVYHQGLRITDEAALRCVKEAAGTVRVEIEAQLSVGLPNSPLSGTRIRVTSGNFVIARPVGVREGVDFRQTGEVRRIDTEGIEAVLSRGEILLLSAVGYSPTGEIFNLRSEDVATETAIALQADKLILVGETALLDPPGENWIRQLTSEEALKMIESRDFPDNALKRHLKAAIRATESGVKRVHYLHGQTQGALILELFTRDGSGTLVSRTPFEALRDAEVGDVPGLLDLILPLESRGVLVPRSRERLESEIGDYAVLDRDGTIVGCGALRSFEGSLMSEAACLALHPDYQGEGRGSRLLDYLEARARTLGHQKVFVLTTQTEHWFRERGYEATTLEALPAQRQRDYDPGRNSKILIKTL